jgi:hypothetical protein
MKPGRDALLRTSVAALSLGAVLAIAGAAGHARAGQPAPTPSSQPSDDDEKKRIADECEQAYEQSQVEQNAGHLVAAKAQLEKCADDRCPNAMKTECGNALPALLSSLPTVVFDAVDDKGAQVIKSKVTVDGKPAADSIDGHEFAIDPGPHKVRFEAAGKEPIELDVAILAGQQHRAVQGQYKGVGLPPPPPGRPFGFAPWIVVGAGAAIAGIGIGVLVSGLGDISDAEKKCGVDRQGCPDQASVDLGQRGIAKATAGKVLIPVGGIALAGALVWQFVFNGDRSKAPSSKPAARVDFQVGPSGFGWTLDGTF